MKEGDTVEIIIGDCEYYRAGDKAVLAGIDGGGDWWADFTVNDEYYGDGHWCVGESGKNFKLYDA